MTNPSPAFVSSYSAHRFLASLPPTPLVVKPPARQQPTEPASYARLSWYVAAVVAWVLLGTLLAKYELVPAPARAVPVSTLIPSVPCSN